MIITTRHAYDILYLGRPSLRLLMHDATGTFKNFDLAVSCVRRKDDLDIVLILKYVLW